MRTTDDESDIWWMDLERYHDHEWGVPEAKIGSIVYHSGSPIGVVTGGSGVGGGYSHIQIHSNPRQSGKQALQEAILQKIRKELRIRE